MRNQTELMRAILTDETAQDIIDFISPLYGNSYVGLWCIQAIGVVLGRVSEISDQLMQETNPVTSSLLLDYWEEHYGIPRNPDLTDEQRRSRLAAKTQAHGSCNPVVLENAISAALHGAEVNIEENVSKNKFLVNIRDYVEDISPAVAVLERMKPAHLIYQIRVAMQTVSEGDIKIAIAMTHGEMFTADVIEIE